MSVFKDWLIHADWTQIAVTICNEQLMSDDYLIFLILWKTPV